MDWYGSNPLHRAATDRPRPGTPGKWPVMIFWTVSASPTTGWTTTPPFTLRPAIRWRRFWARPLPKTSSLCNRQKKFYLPDGGSFISAQLAAARLSFADEGDLNWPLGVQPGPPASCACCRTGKAGPGASVSGAAPLPEHLHLAHCHGRAGAGGPGSHPCPGRPAEEFAPTPSGRMHLGNLFSALLAWLSIRSQGGELVLRMEDLDPQRTGEGYAAQLRQDLAWLGLTWDRETEPQPPPDAYLAAFRLLEARGLLYPCYCTRSRLHRADAPHAADGVYVYDGRCRDLSPAEQAAFGRAPPGGSGCQTGKFPSRMGSRAST